MNPTHTKSDLHLVIVDVQHDFAHPEGALFVPGAEQAVKNIADLLHDPHVTQVTFTLDWHPFDHSSFKAHGGIWPRHCVQFSKGASLHESLWVENFDRLDTHFVRKGQLRDCEEYGAFADPTPEQREWLNPRAARGMRHCRRLLRARNAEKYSSRSSRRRSLYGRRGFYRRRNSTRSLSF